MILIKAGVEYILFRLNEDLRTNASNVFIKTQIRNVSLTRDGDKYMMYLSKAFHRV